MNLKNALVVGLSLWTLSGCAEEAQVPCSAETCLDVSGSYSVTVQAPVEGNTCKHIRYTAGDQFPMTFTLTQTGSALEFHVAGTLEFTMPGTLFENHSASFKQHLDHIVVHGPPDYDYADDAQATLVFSKTDTGMFVSGTMSDTITANADPVPDDQICSLNATLTGQR